MSEENGTDFTDDAARQAWLDTLPEPVRAWQEATTAKSPESFYEQMGNVRSQVGRSLVFPSSEATPEQWQTFFGKAIERSNGRLMVIPGADDSDEVRSAYRKALGVPEAAENYELPVIDGISPELMPEERAKALKSIAHEAGIPAKHFTEVAGKLLQLDQAAIQAHQTAQGELQDALKTEWGEAYEQRYDRVSTFLERDGAPEALVKAAQNKQLGPDAAKYFYGLVERMGSESASIARESAGETVDTPGDLEQRLTDIMGQDGQNGRPLGPYWDPSHPDHKTTRDRAMAIRVRLNPKLSKVPPGQPGWESAQSG